MVDMIRRNPLEELPTARDFRDMMEHFFEGLETELPWSYSDAKLPIDMYETAEAVVVKADLPGMKAEDLDITVTGDTLTIKAECAEEQGVKEEQYYRRERCPGTLSRSVQLPNIINTDDATANFKDGVLTLTFPKLEEIKAKSISIKAE